MDRATRTRIVLAVLLAATLGVTLYSHWLWRRHYFPGNWLGRTGFFAINPIWPLLALFFFSASVAILIARRQIPASLAMALFIFTPCFIPWPIGDHQFRYQAERSRYQEAIRTRRPFGDQHSEVVNGRTLTYWRWMSWDIDNGIGIIYDPQNRLSTDEGDRKAFEAQTGGILFRVERLEPKWFYVVHS